MRFVGVYVGLRTGPGCPRDLIGVLRSFRGGINKWGISYVTSSGERIVFPCWALGPFKWGIRSHAHSPRVVDDAV